jgi:hypothetical protein
MDLKIDWRQVLRAACQLIVGSILFCHPNRDIVNVCPDSNIWYLAFLHAVVPEYLLIPFTVSALLDECNRTNLIHSAPYIMLLSYYVVCAICLGVVCFMGAALCLLFLFSPPCRVAASTTTA